MHSCRSNKGRRCSRRRGSIPLSSTLALAGLSPACIASPGSFFYRRGGRGSAAADRYADVCVTDLRVTFFRRGDRFARLTGGRRTPGRSPCFRSASTAGAAATLLTLSSGWELGHSLSTCSARHIQMVRGEQGPLPRRPPREAQSRPITHHRTLNGANEQHERDTSDHHQRRAGSSGPKAVGPVLRVT